MDLLRVDVPKTDVGEPALVEKINEELKKKKKKKKFPKTIPKKQLSLIKIIGILNIPTPPG